MLQNNKLPKDWKLVELKDVTSILGDGLHGTPKYTNESEYFFINGNNLGEGKITIKENTKKVSVEEYEKYKKNLNDKTVLVSINGTLGNVAFYNNEKVILGKSACYFNVLDSLDKKYIKLLLSGLEFLNYAHKSATGSTIPNVSLKTMREFKFPLPPLETQHAIVSKIEELFSELDKGIEDLKTAQEQLKIYRQSVLKWAFEGKLTNKKVKEGELPKGWETINLSEVIEKPKYGTSKKCDYSVKGKAVLRIPNISKGAVDNLDLKYAEFDAKEIETYSLKEGDLLTIRSNGSVDLVGKCALISKKDEGYLYAGYLIRLRPIMSKINSKYLLNILSSIDLRNQIEHKAKSTSGVNNINSEELSTLNIQLPPIKEQNKIVEEIESRLSVADKIEENISKSLQQAEVLRQSILKKAFSGELI